MRKKVSCTAAMTFETVLKPKQDTDGSGLRVHTKGGAGHGVPRAPAGRANGCPAFGKIAIYGHVLGPRAPPVHARAPLRLNTSGGGRARSQSLQPFRVLCRCAAARPPRFLIAASVGKRAGLRALGRAPASVARLRAPARGARSADPGNKGDPRRAGRCVVGLGRRAQGPPPAGQDARAGRAAVRRASAWLSRPLPPLRSGLGGRS